MVRESTFEMVTFEQRPQENERACLVVISMVFQTKETIRAKSQGNSMFHAYEISRRLLELELCAGAYDYAIASQER